jgi:hypothetical protein
MGSPRPSHRRLGAAAAAVLVLGAGCVSSDLSKDAEVRRQVVECLPTDTAAPETVASAMWFPGSRGFGSSDASPIGHMSGVLALAGDRLWFMSWNEPEHHYDMARMIVVAQAQKLLIDRLGPSVMLVVQSRNLSYDAFELMKAGGLGSDPAGTQELLERLEAIRRRAPLQGE